MKTTAAVKQKSKTVTPKSHKFEKHEMALMMLKNMIWNEGLDKGLTKGDWMVASYQLIEDELLERSKDGRMILGIRGMNKKKINVHFTSNSEGLEVRSEVMPQDSIRL